MKKKPTKHYHLKWIMKISIIQILLLTAFFSTSLAKKTSGQDLLNKKVNLRMQDSEISAVLSEIEKKTDAKFVFSSKTINVRQKVNISVTNKKLKEVLDEFLVTKNITYNVIGEQVVLFPMFIEPQIAKAIVENIKGKIVDNKGDELPGVNIVIKGTKKGTSSDNEGKYTLEANEGEVLVFSFIGYQNQEITVDDRTEYNVVLLEAAGQLSEIVVVGSRGLPRTDVERPVPVDVLNAKELQSTGQVDLGQMVQFNSPSFNSAKTGINGVANYADPATLRGLSPDQVLVLVDGKRRHQFSGLNLNVTVGFGTVVTDLNAIPSLALDRIEILRDGAAAQYGSDAIAGVVNLGLNRSVNKLTFKSQYGVTKEGDGNTFMSGFNYGVKLGKQKGYLNLTMQYQNVKGTDRSDYYNPQPNPTGAYTGIYTSKKETDEIARKAAGVFGEYGTFKVTQYGSNAVKTYQGFYNMGLPLNANWNLYSFGGISKKDIEAFGFFRIANPANANSNPEVFPNGFTPELPGTTNDYSSVWGVNKKSLTGWNWDFSVGMGYNKLDMYANNTVNPSMGASSPTNFYVGQNAFGQTTAEINTHKNIKGWLGTKATNIAFGTQVRQDRFILKKGSAESYFVGPYAKLKNKAPGASGRPGIALEDETDESRSNIGVYADIESDITDKFLLTTALRYENYSDFGSNLSGKLGARLKITDNISVRGSINKGFRAPSLAQTFNSVTTSTVQAGAIVQTKQLKNDDARLQQIGIEQPKAETSWNYNLGVTAKAGRSFIFTLDAYKIDIANRIILSERMIVKDITVLKPLFPGITEVRFFTNHVNTTTKGIDFVTTFNHNFNLKNRIQLSLALTTNKTTITSQKATPSLLQTGTVKPILLIDTVNISLIETAQPRNKILASASFQHEKFNFTTRVSYFGAVTAWEKPAGKPHISQTFKGKTLTDLVLSYNPNDRINLSIGANNVFDIYPDRVLTTSASYSNGQIPFTRNANQFGFNGAFYYGNLTFTF
jgi:iron complex outermembrane receptor protein